MQARTVPGPPDDWWVWAGVPQEHQTVWLQRTFTLPKPAAGELWVAVDDSATVWLNGRKVAEKVGWHNCAAIHLGADSFLDGRERAIGRGAEWHGAGRTRPSADHRQDNGRHGRGLARVPGKARRLAGAGCDPGRVPRQPGPAPRPRRRQRHGARALA